MRYFPKGKIFSHFCTECLNYIVIKFITLIERGKSSIINMINTCSRTSDNSQYSFI